MVTILLINFIQKNIFSLELADIAITGYLETSDSLKDGTPKNYYALAGRYQAALLEDNQVVSSTQLNGLRGPVSNDEQQRMVIYK